MLDFISNQLWQVFNFPMGDLTWYYYFLILESEPWTPQILQDLRFSQRWLWRVSSSGMWRLVVCWVATDISEEHIASIFWVEEIISARTSKQAGASSACHLLACWNYFCDPEDGGDRFLRNVGCNSTDYTASHPRRWYSPQILSVLELNIYIWHQVMNFNNKISWIWGSHSSG
jgi:hypothetical protein